MRILFATFACVLTVIGTASGSLVHRYTFNDGTARDLIGGADGLPVRGPTFGGGQLVFSPTANDGVNTNPVTGQYLDLPNNIAQFYSLSIEAWFTWRGGNAWQRLYDFGSNNDNVEILPGDTVHKGSSSFSFMMLSMRNNQGNPVAQIQGPSSHDATAMTTPLSTNVPHHFVFTQDLDHFTESLYLDGVLVSQGPALLDPAQATYNNYWLGRSQFGADPFFNGSIDEFRIYDDVLTPADVQFNDAQGPNGQISDGANSPTPEPGSMALFALSFALLVHRRTRTGKKAALAAAGSDS